MTRSFSGPLRRAAYLAASWYPRHIAPSRICRRAGVADTPENQEKATRMMQEYIPRFRDMGPGATVPTGRDR